ncbi:MAG: hypothetical protein V7L25_05725 [Nostoc sp.]
MADKTNPIYTLIDILKSTDYALDIFDPEKEIAALELFDKKGTLPRNKSFRFGGRVKQ